MSSKRIPAIIQLPGSEMQRGDIGLEGQQMIKRTRGSVEWHICNKHLCNIICTTTNQIVGKNLRTITWTLCYWVYINLHWSKDYDWSIRSQVFFCTKMKLWKNEKHVLKQQYVLIPSEIREKKTSWICVALLALPPQHQCSPIIIQTIFWKLKVRNTTYNRRKDGSGIRMGKSGCRWIWR